MSRNLTHKTCPECRGPIWEDRQGKILEYRCRVGHAYSPMAFTQEHQYTVERSLWSSIVALEEAADIAERLADGLGEAAIHDAKAKRDQAAVLRSYLASHRS